MHLAGNNDKIIFMKLLSRIILFLPFIFFLFHPIKVIAQEEFDYTKAYKDYVFIQDTYQKAHGEYLLARSQYLDAQTLASQTKAQEKTVAMLRARDEVIVSYLTVVRMRLAETEGISDTEKNSLYSRLDSEINWFGNHKDGLSSAASLDDLVVDSSEAAERFTTIQPLIYEVLGTIPIGRVETLRTSINKILAQIKTKIEEIRANGDHDTTNSERWTIETENKITRSLDKSIEAQKIIYSFQNLEERDLRQINLNKEYNGAITILQESNQLLRESASYMREIIKQIKTKS